MKLVKRSGYYYMRLRRGGVEEWISTHKTNERSAQRSAERILMLFNQEKQIRTLSKQLCKYALSLAKGEIELMDLSSPLAMLEKQAMQKAIETIADVFPPPPLYADDLWERYVELNPSVKEITLECKKQRWNKFSQWAGEMDMRNLNEIMCRSFLDTLNISSLTRNNYIATLSSVFACSEINNPWSSSLRKSNTDDEQTQDRKQITTEQAKVILKYCDDNADKFVSKVKLKQWGQFLRVLYYSGLRPVDASHLKRSEINNGIIELLPEKTSRTRRKVSYKADDKMITLLNSIPSNGTDYYFQEIAQAYDKCHSSLATGFKSILKKCKLSTLDLTLYSFRYHYVTYQIDSGNDDKAVASAVGHNSTDTTNRHYYQGRKNIELSAMPEV